MANYNQTITLGGVTLNVKSLNPFKQQKTQKQVIGKTLVEIRVMGLSSTQWRISISGVITGSSTSDLSSKRASIEALDDSSTHSYSDGIHDGTYYVVPGSLRFSDSQENGGMAYFYSMELVEQ